MKRIYQILIVLFIVSLVVGLSGLAFGQVTSVDANQVTIAWDEVTTNVDSSGFNLDDIIVYEIFRAPYPFIGDRQDPDALENLGATATLQKAITFTVEGEYTIALRALRDVHGAGTNIIPSSIVWSDLDGVPDPFVIRYYKTPENPINIRYL